MTSTYTSRRQLNGLAVALVISVGFCPLAATGQGATRSWSSAKEMLAILEARAESGEPASLGSVVRYPEKFAPATIDSVLAGLEILALDGRSPRTRQAAASSLAQAGSARHHRTDITGRAISVYRRSRDPLVKRTILSFMLFQLDRPSALGFLREISVAPANHQDFEEASFVAVSTISAMGPEGQTLLEELRRKNLVTDPTARGLLEWYLSRQR